MTKSETSFVGTSLVTPRLVLEATRAAHAPGLWAAIEPSRRELEPWLVWAQDASPASVAGFTEQAEKEWRDSASWVFTILLDDEPVGSVGLNGHKPLLATAELGYWMRTSEGGRGLMTEAAAAVVGWGFDEARLHRIELRASPLNGPSLRVAEKIGFKREGIARSACRGSDGWHDVVLFGLLESDERLRP